MDRRQFLKAVGIAGIGGLVGTYSVFIERYLVQVNRYRIPVARLPAVFEGFTIVHLTDLHYGALVPLVFLQGVIEKANNLPRDLTVCTGDYIHQRAAHRQIDTIWPHLAALRAPAGVLSVLGNHDHWGDTGRSLFWMERTGQSLHHGARALDRGGDRLWFVGAGDLWEDHVPLDGLLREVPQGECRVVLAHNPDTADTAFTRRVDLMVCGHTHGGQVRVPFLGTPILPVKNKSYSSGIKRSPGGTPVFISRGIGWAVYPVRFNCPPEIAVLELTRGT